MVNVTSPSGVLVGAFGARNTFPVSSRQEAVFTHLRARSSQAGRVVSWDVCISERWFSGPGEDGSGW